MIINKNLKIMKSIKLFLYNSEIKNISLFQIFNSLVLTNIKFKTVKIGEYDDYIEIIGSELKIMEFCQELEISNDYYHKYISDY